VANPVLSVEGLTTEFATEDGSIQAIENVTFDLYPGETLGIVGESGSGKSVTARSIMHLLDANGRVANGSVRLHEHELTHLDGRELSGIRGTEIAMVFQDPMSSLTPVLTVGTQIVETLREHRDISKAAAKERAIELLADVQIPNPDTVIESYPHQLSGGQRQRVLIAIAISCDPDVLIADEPTTALDVTIETQILDLLDELARSREMSVIQITHDLGVIAETTDRVAVMYAGRIVEQGSIEDVFVTPHHPYTAGLLRSIPRIADIEPEILAGNVPAPATRPQGCNFAPRCPHSTDDCLVDDPALEPVTEEEDVCGEEHSTDGSRQRAACIRTDDIGILDPVPDAERADRPPQSADSASVLDGTDIRKEFTSATSFLDSLLPGGDPPTKAVDGVDVEIREGETIGLVGESGSGKTTLGRLLVSLTERTDGTIRFEGSPLTEVPEGELRSRVQFVFQDPNSSLNPRQTIGRILGFAVGKHTPKADRNQRIDELLGEVGLDPDTQYQYPHELSGGQKQRVGIARALAVDPDVIIADEPTSALDVSVQGQILELLEEIKRERGLSMLFISHDLSVIRNIADRVAVMYLGRIVEMGTTASLFENAQHPYTEALISAVPDPDPRVDAERIVLEGEVPDPKHPPDGCNFVTRCPEAMAECREHDPELAENGENRAVACFLHTNAKRSSDGGD
jgi:peptide/nickel transport system ATP-binding protein